MKYSQKLWIAGMIAGFIMMVVIGYLGIGSSGVLAGDAADMEYSSPEGNSGSSPCPGGCAVCTGCTLQMATGEEMDLQAVTIAAEE